MGRKINPLSYRIGITETWRSQWFNFKKMPQILKEDHQIREHILKQGKNAKIEDIFIERKANNIKIIIKTGRPGLLIGRKGQGVESLQKELSSLLQNSQKMNLKNNSNSNSQNKYNINLSIEEVKKPETSAVIVAQNIAEDIEKRVPYKRALKLHLGKIMQNKEVKGAKLMVSGRLDGAEIARDEWLKDGRLPLTTLRANLEYGFYKAQCSYGVIGIKVWIYKGEIFDKKN